MNLWNIPIPPLPPPVKFELCSETLSGVRMITDGGTLARYLRAIHVDLCGAWYTIGEIADWHGVHWRGDLLFVHNDVPDAGRRVYAAAMAIIGHYEDRGYRK